MMKLVVLVLFAAFLLVVEADYTVTFSTGLEASAGIASTAAIKFRGMTGTSSWILLTRRSAQDLASGTDTEYTVTGDYGDLTSIEVGHNDNTNDAWHLKEVTVVNSVTGTAHVFRCSCWIEPPNLTRTLSISREYSVQVVPETTTQIVIPDSVTGEADLKWSEWSSYGPCSVTCGNSGTQSRTRQKCQDPDTLSGCATTESQSRTCTGLPACPTNPTGPWAAWGACSVTCGTGSRERFRTCDAPVGCDGAPPSQVESCDTGLICPTIASGPWAAWTDCSVTCGAGTRTRSRTCDNPLGCIGTVPTATEVCVTGVLCPTIPLGPWTEWTACTKTCGTGGTQTRERTCDNPAGCKGTAASESQSCNENIVCPTTPDGPWSEWTACSVTCATGTRSRQITCDNPVGCIGQGRIENEQCDTGVVCPTTPAGPWGQWSDCSVTCGSGTRTRDRTCANPAGCTGTAPSETGTCDTGSICPTTPDGPWGPWSQCTATCALGRHTRTRTCTNPLGCEGVGPVQNEQCDTGLKCPNVPDGPWGQWGACSVTCGIGTNTRSRTCDNPLGCLGEAPRETGQCDTGSICPTIPAGPWADWSDCSVTCDRGTHTRSRTCANPLGCKGEAPSETGECDSGAICPTIPAGPYGNWSDCSVTCGTGTHTRERTCVNPLGCKGDAPTDTGNCDTGSICPTIPAGPWGSWSDCSVTCASGTRTRTRTCANPLGCKGEAPTDTGTCDTGVICPTIPAGNWGTWTACSVTCGKGTNTRSRLCDNPAGCKGDAPLETGECDTQVKCPTTPAGLWGEWGQCSVTCAKGTRTRERTCANPVGCKGDAPTETGECDTEVTCPTLPAGPWASWGECSVTCGNGTRARQRTCVNPVGCKGDLTETGDCETGVLCPTNPTGPWGQWGECDSSCGSGERTRSRTCGNPVGCKGEGETDSEYCVADTLCPPTGRWGPWGACSVTCSRGVQIRSRTCQDPQAGCIGVPESETQACLLQECDACQGDMFQCQVSSGSSYCIARSKVCDGVEDCLEGQDESTSAGCDDGSGDAGGVTSASFTLPLVIVIVLIIGILAIVLMIWCLYKRSKRKRKGKVAPFGSQISGMTSQSSTPLFGSWSNLQKKPLVPPKKKVPQKPLYSPDFTRRTVSQRVEAPHIIHLPGDEVIPAGCGKTYRGRGYNNGKTKLNGLNLKSESHA